MPRNRGARSVGVREQKYTVDGSSRSSARVRRRRVVSAAKGRAIVQEGRGVAPPGRGGGRDRWRGWGGSRVGCGGWWRHGGARGGCP